MLNCDPKYWSPASSDSAVNLSSSNNLPYSAAHKLSLVTVNVLDEGSLQA
jgi:hypothetical protein